jgi:hypothetical protein
VKLKKAPQRFKKMGLCVEKENRLLSPQRSSETASQ